jgi:hypothetical protein
LKSRTTATIEVLREIVLQEGSTDIIPPNLREFYENQDQNNSRNKQDYQNISAVIFDLFIDQEKLKGNTNDYFYNQILCTSKDSDSKKPL